MTFKFSQQERANISSLFKISVTSQIDELEIKANEYERAESTAWQLNNSKKTLSKKTLSLKDKKISKACDLVESELFLSEKAEEFLRNYKDCSNVEISDLLLGNHAGNQLDYDDVASIFAMLKIRDVKLGSKVDAGYDTHVLSKRNIGYRDDFIRCVLETYGVIQGLSLSQIPLSEGSGLAFSFLKAVATPVIGNIDTKMISDSSLYKIAKKIKIHG